MPGHVFSARWPGGTGRRTRSGPRRSPRGPAERGVGTRAGAPGGRGGTLTGCLSRPLSPPGSGSGG